MTGKEPVQINVSDDLKVSKSLVVEKLSTDGSKAIRHSDDHTSAFFDMEHEKPIIYGAEGKCPQGDSDDLKVSGILVERLNIASALWGEPRLWPDRNAKIDCFSESLLVPKGKPLLIQVTRAYLNKQYWEGLAHHPTERRATIEELVADMSQSIEHKRSKAESNIVLALNAFHTIAHTEVSVIAAFRKRYGLKSRDVGFKEIWIVGATVKHCYQLDMENDAA